MSLKKVHDDQPKDFKFSEENLKKADEILKKYPEKNKKTRKKFKKNQEKIKFLGFLIFFWPFWSEKK